MISFLPGWYAILKAAVVFALFLFAPGYVAGWLSNVFEFRRASMLRRIPLGAALSAGVTPAAMYLTWRLGDLRWVWWLFGIVWALFGCICAVDAWALSRGRFPGVNRSLLRVGVVSVLVWSAIALTSLPDVRWKNRLYYSVTAFDYASRVPMASDLKDVERLPPQNPYFNPGHGVALRYHYFWPLLCGLASV